MRSKIGKIAEIFGKIEDPESQWVILRGWNI
jgi:rRNA processing protein Gar1